MKVFKLFAKENSVQMSGSFLSCRTFSPRVPLYSDCAGMLLLARRSADEDQEVAVRQKSFLIKGGCQKSLFTEERKYFCKSK